MTKSKGNNNAQFTYDFGIAIAQSTVNKLTRLTGATLTLASAYYALKTAATDYVHTLKESTLRFGGALSTLKVMEQAQDRLIKGLSYFSMEDQLRGMNQLMAAGIDVGENIEWVNKAAHAAGKSYAEFSGMIASAIQGNTQALVDAGLMTQRATRIFDKYAANTVMRQQAILNFVKNHKGLMNAIKNDFETIQDQMLRIKGSWKSFLQSIVGKPNDPQSFYGQVVSSMKLVANSLAKNMEEIKRYGFVIGQVLGWVIKQIGHFVVWVGRQTKKALESVWKVTDDFQNQTRSLLVWLEFWKLKIIDFFKTYGDEIKTILKLLIAFKALKYVFVIGGSAIRSIKAYRAALLGTVALQKRYMASMGPYISKTAKFFQSLAVWLPRPFRKAWVSMGKFFADFSMHMALMGKGITKALVGPLKFIGKSFKFILGLIKNLPGLLTASAKSLRALWVALNATNPVGWILLAISLFVTLYSKVKAYRKFVNNYFKFAWEALKLIYNLIIGIVVYTVAGIKRIWGWFKTYIWEPIANFFASVWTWIGDMWKKFMNTKVGMWINDHIVTPLKTLFNWLLKAWQWILNGMASIVKFFAGSNSKLAKNINDLARAEGLDGLAIAAAGGNYDTNDDTNYLTELFNKVKSFNPGSLDSTGTENPLITDGIGGGEYIGGSSGGNSTNMSFENGAIQIIVQKGEGIDERVLAQKVRNVLNDLKREGDMRGGKI